MLSVFIRNHLLTQSGYPFDDSEEYEDSEQYEDSEAYEDWSHKFSDQFHLYLRSLSDTICGDPSNNEKSPQVILFLRYLHAYKSLFGRHNIITEWPSDEHG
jgi:hypothetical protein